MANPNIFAQYLKPAKSVADFQHEAIQREAGVLDLESKRRTNALQALTMDQSMRKQNALQQIVAGWGPQTSMEDRITSLRGNPLTFGEADSLEGTYLARKKTDAEIKKIGGEAESKKLADAQKRLEVAGQAFGFVKDNPSMESAQAAIQGLLQAGVYDEQGAQAAWAKVQANPTPEGIRALATQAFQQALSAKEQLPQLFNQNRGGTFAVTGVNPVTQQATDVQSAPITQSADNAATNARTAADAAANRAVQMRGQNMTDARARETNQLQRDAARTQIITDPNMGVLAVDKGTGSYRPVTGANGAVIPGENQVAATKLRSQLSEGIKLAKELLPKATGSGAGALADTTANFFGATTEGATAATQLETLAGWLTSNVPRMQGPQSDRDVIMYRQMAASVGDRTVPVAQRLKALETLEALQEKYAGQHGGGSNSGTSAPPAGNVDGLVNKYRSR